MLWRFIKAKVTLNSSTSQNPPASSLPIGPGEGSDTTVMNEVLPTAGSCILQGFKRIQVVEPTGYSHFTKLAQMLRWLENQASYQLSRIHLIKLLLTLLCQ